MTDSRPQFLNLMQIRFPIMAIISILHRISGVLIFLSLPFMMCMFGQSLKSETAFINTQEILSQPLYKLMVWAVTVAIFYHLVAGIRHIIMDFGIGESLRGARIGAYIVLVINIVFLVLAGLWIW